MIISSLSSLCSPCCLDFSELNLLSAKGTLGECSREVIGQRAFSPSAFSEGGNSMDIFIGVEQLPWPYHQVSKKEQEFP